jgi:hypothetical protein
MLKKSGIALLLLIVTVPLVLYVLGNGVLGKVEHAGRIEG